MTPSLVLETSMAVARDMKLFLILYILNISDFDIILKRKLIHCCRLDMENSCFMRPYGGYHDDQHGGMDDPRFQEYYRQHSSCPSEQQSVYSTR